MAITHTKSTSGRTHRLNVNGTVVELRYREVAHNDHIHDEQVEGDLVRKYWKEGGVVTPIGIIGCRIDPALDAEEKDWDRLSPEQIATTVLKAARWDPETHDQLHRMIARAVRMDRDQR